MNDSSAPARVPTDRLIAYSRLEAPQFAIALIGFDATRGVVNSREAIDGLRFFFAGAPMACFLGGLLIVRGYPLTSTRHTELRTKLAGRSAANSAPNRAS
ncbi:MAG TPA: hypothetical protein EYQ60_06125 [Myxococcales bacterium]|nr:hypothetical protein [Myxococcales bacterium]HIK85504.1 hypothetical protein [Myxococcales bacterium]